MEMDFHYFDLHSHVNDARFDSDRDAVYSSMAELGVGTIAIGTDRDMSARAIACAESNSSVWATIGQHPVDRDDEIFDYDWYKTNGMHARVVGIGECGLDYYWPSSDGWKTG